MDKTHNFVVVGGDTDGLAFKKRDEKAYTPEERQTLLDELNALMPELIRWEDDGVVKTQIVIAAKNYVLEDEKGKLKFKGNSLKAPMKEKALRDFLQEVIRLLIKGKKDQIFPLYFKLARDICNIKDISDWCSKKTVTKAVLDPSGTAQERILDAIGDREVQEGDKIYVFFRTPEELCLRENFDGTYDRDTLLEKLYKTLEIFENVIDVSLFPNFALKRNRALLGEIPNEGIKQPKLGTTVGDHVSAFPPGFFQIRS